jgi:8-oxo-dGTP diphosphatase
MTRPEESRDPEVPQPRASRIEAGDIIEVAAGVVFRRGKLLITQRRPGDHLGGLWEFPGGKREGMETFRACLRRELFEELGIQVEPGELLGSFTHAYPEKTVHLKFFHCACENLEPRELGCHAIAWVGRDELHRFEFPAADARLLVLLESRPELWD